VMLNRNKVHRACIEREIYSLLDHPFLPTLYTSFQVSSMSYVAVSYLSHLKLIIMKKVYNLPAYGFCKEAIHLRVFYLVILFSRKIRIQIYMTNQLIIVYFSDTNTCLSDNRLLSWRRIICTT